MMQYKGYFAHIEFDDEANIFHGEVVNIRDVITFQGESVENLKNAFVDSIEDYLNFCAARGEQPEEPFSGRFTVRLSPDQHKKVVMAAAKAGKNIDAWVSDILVDAAA